LEPVAVALGELLVLHAEPPVGIPGGEPPQGGDLGELVVVEDLEDRLVEVEPVVARMLLGLELELAEVRREVVFVAHDRHLCEPLDFDSTRPAYCCGPATARRGARTSRTQRRRSFTHSVSDTVPDRVTQSKISVAFRKGKHALDSAVT